MDILRHHLNFSLKLLFKGKGFTIATLLTLALCIGANSAVFSAVNALILRPLPYEDPDHLVVVFKNYPRSESMHLGCSVPDYFARRDGVEAFEDVAVFTYTGRTIGEVGKPERIFTLGITPSFLQLLRVQPINGRNFTEEETQSENAGVVILGYEFWQERFGGEEVLGKEIRIDGDTHTIVGILPRGFRQLDEWQAELYVPLEFTEEVQDIVNLHSNSVSMIARLAPGATIEQAEEQLASLDDRLLDEWPAPNGRQLMEDAGFYTSVMNLQDALMRTRRPIFWLLMAGVMLVLMIGCVNIAHLMVARLNMRRVELATRIALGANKRQLYGQMLTESLLLGLVGGILSLAVAFAGLQVMNALQVDELPFGETISLDMTVLLFTFIISIAAGVFFGTLPIFQILRTDLHTVFRYDGRTVTAGRRTVRYRNLLSITQVATAFVLLTGSGLLLSSFKKLINVDPGFQEPESILNGFIALPDSRYPDENTRLQFIDRVLEEVRTLPGVKHAAITSRLPFVTFESYTMIIPEGYIPRAGESVIAHRTAVVSPGYFNTMGIPLLEGRDFQESDNSETPRAIIIDRWLSEHYWPGESPVGKRMYSGVPDTPEEEIEEENLYTVIGVVGSVRYAALSEVEAGGRGAFYRPYRQIPIDFMLLAIRTELEPLSLAPAVQKIVLGIDAELPFYFPTTLDERISDTLFEHRIPMVLITIFAALALFLAAVGLYGVLSYTVNQRTRELGIRMALGSSPKELFRLVLSDGLRVLMIGLALGIITTLLLAGIIRSLLFGIAPSNLIVIGSVLVVLGVVTILASLFPARRATRVDPVTALNYE